MVFLSNKTIAYLRISTQDQELDNQRLAILNYAHNNKLQIDEFLEKKISKASIAKILDVSRSALLHFIKSRKL